MRRAVCMQYVLKVKCCCLLLTHVHTTALCVYFTCLLITGEWIWGRGWGSRQSSWTGSLAAITEVSGVFGTERRRTRRVSVRQQHPVDCNAHPVQRRAGWHAGISSTQPSTASHQRPARLQLWSAEISQRPARWPSTSARPRRRPVVRIQHIVGSKRCACWSPTTQRWWRWWRRRRRRWWWWWRRGRQRTRTESASKSSTRSRTSEPVRTNQRQRQSSTEESEVNRCVLQRRKWCGDDEKTWNVVGREDGRRWWYHLQRRR